jgi:hypothetical protein
LFSQREQNVDMARNMLRSAKVLVITLVGSNSTASFSPVQHAIEDMALSGPALVMDEPPRLAQSLESTDDRINSTTTESLINHLIIRGWAYK